MNTESRFIARQAILDNTEQLFAYEILYRNSTNNIFPNNVSDTDATSSIIFNTMLLHHIKQISNNTLIFINLSTETLLDKLPNLLNPAQVVIEITERTEDLTNVLLAVKKLKQKGFCFALDDYDGDEKWDNLIHEVDYIKLEICSPLLITLLQIKELKRKYPQKKIIVERIEDYETYYQLKQNGCDYFQGYFFAKPEIKQFKSITPAKLVILRLINLVNNKTLNFTLIQTEIEKDIALSVRLLRLFNNVTHAKKVKLNSVSQILIYLGEDMIRQYIKLLAVSMLSTEKPSELLVLSLVRARFMSSMTQSDKAGQENAYFVGLISLLDAILNVELMTVLVELNIDNTCQGALINYEGKIGILFLLCKKIEQNDWRAVCNIADRLELEVGVIEKAYHTALSYADQSLNVKQALTA